MHGIKQIFALRVDANAQGLALSAETLFQGLPKRKFFEDRGFTGKKSNDPFPFQIFFRLTVQKFLEQADRLGLVGFHGLNRKPIATRSGAAWSSPTRSDFCPLFPLTP